MCLVRTRSGSGREPAIWKNMSPQSHDQTRTWLMLHRYKCLNLGKPNSNVNERIFELLKENPLQATVLDTARKVKRYWNDKVVFF